MRDLLQSGISLAVMSLMSQYPWGLFGRGKVGLAGHLALGRVFFVENHSSAGVVMHYHVAIVRSIL
eukprot:5155334-Pleurochrysis_carterae.AAC.1